MIINFLIIIQDIMKNTDLVLSWLEDEESKYIYKKKVEYNETHEYRLIRDIIDSYIPQLSGKKYYPGIERELVNRIRENKKIAIFGAGMLGENVIGMLHEENIVVDVLIDNDESKWGKLFCDMMVSEPSKVDYRQIDMIIITPYVYQQIKNQLLTYGLEEEKMIVYKEYCPYILEEEQYFDENIITLSEEEVFVDGGVLDLETSLLFCEKCTQKGIEKYRVHAFEPDRASYSRCRKLVESKPAINLYNEGLWKEKTTLFFDEKGNGASRIAERGEMVSVVSLDQYIHDKVTFIKLDVEGAELEALQGAKNIIQTQKPKLAICIYHKNEDMTEIPIYIKNLVPEYKLYVRHYSNASLETVLYAVL